MSQLTDNLSAIASIKSDIKDAIEAKGVSMSGVSFGSYADKIGEITTSFVTVPLSVSVNGTYTPGQGVDGFSQVVVSVPIPEFVTGTLYPTSNSTYTVSAPVDGWSQVVVSVPAVTETLNVSVNNTYYPGQGVDGFSQVIVDVPQSVTGFTQKDLTEKNVVIVNLSNSASFVASEVFFWNSTIQTVSLPNCTLVGRAAFTSCRSLTDLYIPMCQTIQEAAFQGCTSLEEVNLPNCTKLSASIFENCTSLSYASVCITTSSISVAVFKNTGLTSVYFDGPFIGHYTFEKCRNLSEIYLGSTSVTVLGDGTFVSTPIASGTGSIYVPASLVSDYQNDSNWSSYSSQIFPISSPEPPVIEGNYFSYTPTNLEGMMKISAYGVWENISSYNGLYNDPNWEDGTIYDEAFYSSTYGTTISFVTFETNAIQICPYVFSNCTTLTSLRFTNLSEAAAVNGDAFYGCTSLSTVYVDFSDYTCIFEPDAFNGTPLANGVGSIYVPAAVYNDYLTECAETPFVSRFVSY